METGAEADDLAGERISLRRARRELSGPLYTAARESAQTVGAWMSWCHAQYTIEESEAWLEHCESTWESGEAYEFAIFDRSDQYVGGAGLNQFNRVHNFANLGYWVRESRQRQGLAIEAVRMLAQFGFKTLGLTRIEIVAASENLPSRRVAEKAGAVFECLARNRLVLAGIPKLAALYSLVPDAAIDN